jgi:hypothetical protein
MDYPGSPLVETELTVTDKKNFCSISAEFLLARKCLKLHKSHISDKIDADSQIGYFLKLPKLTIKIRLNSYEYFK